MEKVKMVNTRTGTVVVRSRMPAPLANAASFGGGVARAMQQTGYEMNRTGRMIDDEADKQAQKDAVNRGMEWESDFEKLRREKVNSDILTRKGKQALGSTAEWDKAADEWYQKKLKEVGNDYERLALNSMYKRRNSATLDTLSRFEAQEKERYFDENTTFRIKSAIEDSLANYEAPDLVEQSFNSGLAALKTNYAGRGEILDAKIKEYKDSFYNAQVMKRADTDADSAIAYFEENKNKFSETTKSALSAVLKKRKSEQEEHQKKEIKKEAMLCIYGDSESCNNLLESARSGKMSLAEIEAAMPATAGTSFKNLIYRMQGYKTGPNKLDNVEQLALKQKIYEGIGAVTSNKEAKIEDFKEMQDLIYEGIDKKALEESEGRRLLNNISAPLMKVWEEKIDKYSDNDWLEPNLGTDGINDWLKENYLIGNEVIEKETKERRPIFEAANARVKTEAYQLYYDNLQDIVDETKGLNTVADILKLKENDRRRIYSEAQERVKQEFAVRRYQSLRNQSVNPTYILSNRDGMVQISGRPEQKAVGKPLTENRVVKVAYDKTNGKYGLVMSDGTVKEVSREVYQTYGGKN